MGLCHSPVFQRVPWLRSSSLRSLLAKNCPSLPPRSPPSLPRCACQLTASTPWSPRECNSTTNVLASPPWSNLFFVNCLSNHPNTEPTPWSPRESNSGNVTFQPLNQRLHYGLESSPMTKNT